MSPPDIQGGFCHSFSQEQQAGGSLSPSWAHCLPWWTHSALVGSLPLRGLSLPLWAHSLPVVGSLSPLMDSLCTRGLTLSPPVGSIPPHGLTLPSWAHSLPPRGLSPPGLTLPSWAHSTPSWTHLSLMNSLSPLVVSLSPCDLTLSPCGVPIGSNPAPPSGASDLTRALTPEALSHCQSVSCCEALGVCISPLWNRLGPSEFTLFGSQTPWLFPLRVPAGLAQEPAVGSVMSTQP